jgi:hypothetical protein
MGHTGHTATARSRTEQIPSGQLLLEGELSVPAGATGVVLFAHGSGSSRHSPRNQFVAQTIREEVAHLSADWFQRKLSSDVVVERALKDR